MVVVVVFSFLDWLKTLPAGSGSSGLAVEDGIRSTPPGVRTTATPAQSCDDTVEILRLSK